jgi:hypothetical protein
MLRELNDFFPPQNRHDDATLQQMSRAAHLRGTQLRKQRFSLWRRAIKREENRNA